MDVSSPRARRLCETVETRSEVETRSDSPDLDSSDDQPLIGNEEPLSYDGDSLKPALISSIQRDQQGRLIVSQQLHDDIIDSGIHVSSGDSCGSSNVISTSIKAHHEIKIYWYRWYILAVFSVTSMMATCEWNTWGPIEASARAVYGWTDGAISLLTSWGVIMFLIAVFPSAWFLNAKGLRASVLFALICLVVGGGLRCIPAKDQQVATVIVNIAQAIIGIAGPITQASATALSSAWFPTNQRTTATAIGSLSTFLGNALSFYMGPACVTDVETYDHKDHNKSDYLAFLSVVHDDINFLLYLQGGICAVLLLLVFFTFPDKPPTPPSASASVERTINFRKSMWRLLKHKDFQLIAFMYGISTGVYSAWLSMLAINLAQFGFSDELTSSLAVWAVISGAVGGVSLSSLSDRLGRKKPLAVVMLFLATASFLVFSLLCQGFLPKLTWLLYLSGIVSSVCVNGAIPLFFELAVETTYPVSEGVTTMVMTFSNNVYCQIYLTIPMLDIAGKLWMNWAMLGACAMCLPMFLCFTERKNRSCLDEDQTNKVPPGSSIDSSSGFSDSANS